MTNETSQGAALSDADYLLALVENRYEGLPAIKAHHDRMRAIAARLEADRRLTAEQGGADAALKRIITAYDAYRRRGVAPAPVEYSDVVEAIESGRAALTTQPQAEPAVTRALIEECRAALAIELTAWDIEPPLHHVKTAHDKCVAWLATAPTEPT